MTRGISKREKSLTNIRKKCCTKKCLTTTLAFVIFASIVSFIVFWCTDFYQSAILSSLIIRNNTPMFEWWTKPPIRAVYKVTIFNYTNVEDFEKGLVDKLKVEEAGPYIYRETLTRVDQTFHPNGSITFKEKRHFQWEGGSPDDEVVIVPNVPLLSAIALARDINYMVQLAFTGILTSLEPKTFINVPAGGFLWGYDDKLFDMAKPIISLQENIPFNKFGILAYKNGISQHSMTMQTGRDDHRKLGVIERISGQKNRNIWHDEDCDRIHGTEGFMFPPDMYAKPNAILDIYAVDMCRTLRLESQGSGESFGIPTLKFKPAADIFTSTPTKQACFCSKSTQNDQSKRTCPPAGIFNGSACSFNMPIMASFPHFYGGDSILRENIEGLNPQKDLHESFIELHPRLGILIGGSSKLQMNVEARKAIGVPFLGNIKDGQILPLIWVEVAVDNIPEPLLTLFKHGYFTIGIVESFLQWSSVFCIILSTIFMMYILRKNPNHTTLKRNVSGQDKLLEENC